MDDYNPVDHRSPDQLTTTSFAVFMHLMKAAAGSGVLFLPHAFKNAGYLAAIVCSAFVGIICIHTAVLTVRCSQILCKRSRVPALNLAETAEASFKLGPRPLQKFAGAFALTANFTVCFIQYQTAVVYMLYVVSSFKQILEHFTDCRQDLRVYIFVFLPLFCLFALVPDFNFLAPFSVIGTFFLVSGILVSFHYFLTDIQPPARLNAITEYEQLGVYSSVFVYSLYNMSVLMPLENTMRNPRALSMLLAIGMVVNGCVCVVFGFFGYNKYEDACDTIIKNLPLDELPAQIVKITVSLSVMFTFGLQYLVPVKILWPMIASKVGDSIWYEVCFRLGGVLACALVALILPHLSSLLALFSAISFTTLMILIPIVMETSTKWNDPGKVEHTYMVAKNLFIFAMWLLILFFGVRESIRDIIREQQESESSESSMCQ